MEQQDEFYIGYFPKAPRGHKKPLIWFVALCLVSIPLVAGLLVSQQNGFSASSFELGQLTQIEGVYTSNPVPMLRIEAGQDADVHLVAGRERQRERSYGLMPNSG